MDWLEAVVHTTTMGADIVSDVLMNAGAYGAELAQLVTQAEGVSLSDGRRVVYPADRLDFAYRHSALMDAGVVITQATLALTPGDPEAIRARMEA